jgi:hypothetical protein
MTRRISLLVISASAAARSRGLTCKPPRDGSVDDLVDQTKLPFASDIEAWNVLLGPLLPSDTQASWSTILKTLNGTHRSDVIRGMDTQPTKRDSLAQVAIGLRHGPGSCVETFTVVASIRMAIVARRLEVLEQLCGIATCARESRSCPRGACTQQRGSWRWRSKPPRMPRSASEQI